MQRFALAIAATLVFSGLAHADDVRKVEVSYDDLDLTHGEQANLLYTRIEHAAQNVCEVNTVPQPRKLILEHRCVRKAVDDAVHRVDNPNLTAVYLAKAGTRAMVASSR
jgi:UrcA family protein